MNDGIKSENDEEYKPHRIESRMLANKKGGCKRRKMVPDVQEPKTPAEVSLFFNQVRPTSKRCRHKWVFSKHL